MKLKTLMTVAAGLAFAWNAMAAAATAGAVSSGAREALQKYVAAGKLPGAAYVLFNNGVEEVGCVGYADVAAKRAITLDDPYMQCSQTKGFCGVTIAILVEEGKIKLDDPVSKYLPEFRELWIQTANKGGVRTLVKAKNTLTIRNVLNHTGGFPFELANYERMGGWSRRMPLRSVAATAAAAPILFEPGTRSQYSNVGIDIGAAVVEVVSGMRWERFLSERVFKPLGMTVSTFVPSDELLSHQVELYRVGRKGFVRMDCASPMQRPYNDDRVFASAGAGLWTTVRDQLKFYKMLMNLGVGENGVRILKPETVRGILAVSSRPKNLDGYSLGLAAPKQDGENEWFGHGGAWGTNCMVNWHKKQLRLWVVQLQGGPRPWDRDFRAAANRFFKATAGGQGDAYTGRMK